MSDSDSHIDGPAVGEQWKDFRGEVGTIVKIVGHMITWKPNNDDAYDGGHARDYYDTVFIRNGFKYVGPAKEQ